MPRKIPTPGSPEWEQGYRYRGGKIFDPNGIEILAMPGDLTSVTDLTDVAKFGDPPPRKTFPVRQYHRSDRTYSVPMEAPPDPERPVPGDDLNILRGRATALMAHAVQIAQELTEQSHPGKDSMLDEIIMQGRVSGLSTRDIALRIDPSGKFSEAEVIQRLSRIYARQAEFTSTEWRQLQTMRLETLINSVHGFVLNGSESHAEVYLKAIERLNKLYDLEANKTKIEVELVSQAQATLFLTIMDAAIKVILSDQRIKDALDSGAIHELAGVALDAAQEVLMKGQDERVVIDG